VTFDEHATQHNRRRLQNTLLRAAVDYNVSDSVERATSLFERWKDGERFVMKFQKINNCDFSVSPDAMRAVLSAGVAHGTLDDWEYVFDKFKSAVLPVDKTNYLGALSGTPHLATLKRYTVTRRARATVTRAD